MKVNGFNIDDPEESYQYLKSQGVDIDRIVEKGMKIINKIKSNEKIKRDIQVIQGIQRTKKN
jgi:biotin operon repressor